MNKSEYTRCNLCNSNNYKIKYKVAGFNIVRCNKCSLLYVNPRLSQQELIKIYDKGYFTNKEISREGKVFGYWNYYEDRANLKKDFLRKINDILNFKSEGSNLLDIGCGEGDFIAQAGKKGLKSVGIEINQSAIDSGMKKYNIQIYKSDIENFDTKYRYDIITIYDTIEHLRNPDSCIKRSHDLLKNNGIIVIVTPDSGSVIAKILGRGWEEFQRVREHIYFFSAKTLTRMLRKNNFKVIQIKTIGKHFSLHTLISRFIHHNPRIGKIIKPLLKLTILRRINIYFNPGYKMQVIAKKI